MQGDVLAGAMARAGMDESFRRDTFEALLLSREAAPDHVWEPQTTKLLAALAARPGDILVGGAYIGDQVVPIARVAASRDGRVHAFEPMR